MNINNILNSVLLTIFNDQDTGENDLGNILGEIRAVKGPRKPKEWDECFTIHIPSNPRDSDTKIHTGTLNINYYCPNYSDGNANVEKMGAVVARLIELFDDKWPDIEGYKIADWSVKEPLGPLWDSNEPDEHFSCVRIGFVIQKI